GTPFGLTVGTRCGTATYYLNANYTVKVVNDATVGKRHISIEGTATPAEARYEQAGVFKVAFLGMSGAECEGPDYVVQDFCDDFAIMQTQNWTTL
ncbi:hypothetical protein K458DRAFT_395435, partial [Lentithecium fluviatile CBS 122367]